MVVGCPLCSTVRRDGEKAWCCRGPLQHRGLRKAKWCSQKHPLHGQGSTISRAGRQWHAGWACWGGGDWLLGTQAHFPWLLKVLYNLFFTPLSKAAEKH